MTQVVCDVCGSVMKPAKEKGKIPVAYFFIEREDKHFCSRLCASKFLDKWSKTATYDDEIKIRCETGKIETNE